MCLSRGFLLLLLAFTAGCYVPRSKKPDDAGSTQPGAVYSDAASFFLTSIEARFIAATGDPDINVPLSQTLSWKVCLKDRRDQSPVLGHKFRVQGSQDERELVSDGNGCLSWNEVIRFNYLADEKYLALERKLVADGRQVGRATVTVIVNPWAGTAFLPDEKETGVDVVPAAQTAAGLTGFPSQAQRPLILDGVRGNITQGKIKGESSSFFIDLSSGVFLERWDAKPSRRLEKLTFNLKGGSTRKKLIADFQLMCVIHPSNAPPRRAVVARIKNVKSTMISDGIVTFHSPFTLREYCTTTTTMMVGISARLVEETEQGTVPALPHLAPFEGVFVVGPVNHVVGMGFWLPDPRFAEKFLANPNYTVEHYLSEGQVLYVNQTPPPSPEELRKKGLSEDRAKVLLQGGTDSLPEFMQRFRFEFDSLSLEPYQYHVPAYAKTINRQFRARACLRLGVDQGAVRNVALRLTKMNGEELEVMTQNNGCFEWMDSVTFNFLGYECRSSRQRVKIRSETYDMERVVDVYLNPWASGSAAAPVLLWFSGQDSERPKDECKTDKSKIILSYYYQDYYLDRFQYRLDDLLNLSHVRWANLSLQPILKRPSFSDPRGFEERKLPMGKYLLRYAIVDQHVKNYENAAELKNRVYSIGRAMVSVRADGAITDLAPMETPPDAVASLMSLNQLILELVPLKEEAQLLDQLAPERLEEFVDEDTAIAVAPFGGQLIFQSESGGFRQIPEWDGRSLVKHLESFHRVERKEILERAQALARKENMARHNELELFNLNSPEEIEKLQNHLAAAAPPLGLNLFGNRGEAIAPERARRWLEGESLDAVDLNIFCGYIFRHLWQKPFADGRDAYPALSSGAKGRLISMLVQQCQNQGLTDAAKPFSVEYKYFVKNPRFVPDTRCVNNPRTGQEDCESRVVPQFAKSSFSFGRGFFMSKDYGAGQSWGGEVKTKMEFPGAGLGFSYGIGSAAVEVKGNSVSYNRGLDFKVDQLRFLIEAEDAERCAVIRVNPAMVYKKDRWLILWKSKNAFARALRPDLTDLEISDLFSRGLMICEGQLLGRPLRFHEDYYFIRAGADKGMMGDTLSSLYVKSWFASLRGVGDFVTFRSLFQNSYDYPTSYENETTTEAEDLSPVQANFARGSRSTPGVFSSPVPLK